MGGLWSVGNSVKGFSTFLMGLGWLRKHPLRMVLLFIPMALAFFLLATGWGVFYKYHDPILNWVMFTRPESWWWLPFYYLSLAVVYGMIVVLGVLLFVLLVNVLSSPLYEIVSLAVEKDMYPERTVPELSLGQSLALVAEELKKVFFILLVSLCLLMIPGLNVITPFVTAFCVGWDFYDYPLARRGWHFKKRLKFVLSDFWTVMGFGCWFLIPGLQFFLMPLAVPSGTMLSLRHLEERHQLEETKQ